MACLEHTWITQRTAPWFLIGEVDAIDLADNLAWLGGLRESLEARLSPARWGVLGFSQGGHTAARWLAHAPARWDRVVLWGAAVPSELSPEALRAGLGDATLELPPEALAQVLAEVSA